MADNKNTNVEETIEVEATVNETEATEVEADVLDEKGNVEPVIAPVSVFSKIGAKIDSGLTHGKKFFKKNGKKMAVGAAVAGGGIALAAAGMALSDLDKKLGAAEPAGEAPFDNGVDYERVEKVGLEAANAEIERQLAEAEAPVEEIGAEA